MSAIAYLAAWRIVRFLPTKLARKIFAQLAMIAYRKDGKGVRQLRRNLSVVTGKSGSELEDLVKGGLVSYSRYWVEAFQLPSYSNSKVMRMVKIANPEIFKMLLVIIDHRSSGFIK